MGIVKKQLLHHLFCLCILLFTVGCRSHSYIQWNEDLQRATQNNSGVPVALNTIAKHPGSEKTQHLLSHIDFHNPLPICQYIWSNLPDKVVVYPSERYYYYQLYKGNTWVFGNFRLSDITQNTLYFACYNGRNRSQVASVTLDSATDNFSVSQIQLDTFRVRWLGKTVDFVLYQPPLLRDESSLARAKDSVLFASEEQIVTGLLDDSGIAFVLLYNNNTNAFYYCLNESITPSQALQSTAYDRIWIEPVSQFVFLQQQEDNHIRYLLVGVNSENIAKNNYYDGPFDQVPPDLDIKSMLEQSYPYVQYRGGIDTHGNFVALASQRVAISPYVPYHSIDLLANTVLQSIDTSRPSSEEASILTYEPKRDYHKTLQARPAPGTISVMGYIEHLLKPALTERPAINPPNAVH